MDHDERSAADGTPAVGDADRPEPAESSSDSERDAGSAPGRPRRALPPWLQYALAAAAVLAVLAFILIPRFTEPDPYESLGEEGSPARSVAAALDASMTCTAGEIAEARSVLACYQQTADQLAMVFLQSDRAGRIASYTVETQPLGTTPDTGQALSIANQVAGLATPGGDFSSCSHSYGAEYFCFGSLASWKSTDVEPVESTGAKKRLPSVDELGSGLNARGWDCEYGICVNGDTSMSTAQSLTGLGLQFAAPVDLSHVQQAVAELLRQTDDTDDLQEWVETIDGRLNIVVANGFVIGYVPQVGDSGMVVVDEVAGVLPDTA